eukprot:750623-Hanusia_phi.AAC.1
MDLNQLLSIYKPRRGLEVCDRRTDRTAAGSSTRYDDDVEAWLPARQLKNFNTKPQRVLAAAVCAGELGPVSRPVQCGPYYRNRELESLGSPAPKRTPARAAGCRKP